ncbi:MAG: hypothetical protein AAB567_01525 [Patescibacteria group bacterium]
MNIVPLIAFLGSLVGILVILYRKVPVLLQLPPDGAGLKIQDFVPGMIRKIAKSERWKKIALEKVLQKILSKARVLALKTENRTGEWLEKLRQRSQERKTRFTESYWEQFKKKAKIKKEK